MTNDLAAWLLEQIADDERVALAVPETDRRWSYRPAIPAATGDGRFDSEAVLDLERTVLPADGDEGVTVAEAQHVARWSPAGVLAECDAKRRIVQQVVPGIDGLWDQIEGEFGVGPSVPCEESALLLRLLALPYADRPGYREEWRP